MKTILFDKEIWLDVVMTGFLLNPELKGEVACKFIQYRIMTLCNLRWYLIFAVVFVELYYAIEHGRDDQFRAILDFGCQLECRARFRVK